MFCEFVLYFWDVNLFDFWLQIYRLVNKMTSNGDTLKRRTVSPAKQQLNGSECQHEIDELKEKLKRDRESLVLWRRPFRTLNYFFKELIIFTYASVNRWDLLNDGIGTTGFLVEEPLQAPGEYRQSLKPHPRKLDKFSGLPNVVDLKQNIIFFELWVERRLNDKRSWK